MLTGYYDGSIMLTSYYGRSVMVTGCYGAIFNNMALCMCALFGSNIKMSTLLCSSGYSLPTKQTNLGYVLG